MDAGRNAVDPSEDRRQFGNHFSPHHRVGLLFLLSPSNSLTHFLTPSLPSSLPLSPSFTPSVNTQNTHTHHAQHKQHAQHTQHEQHTHNTHTHPTHSTHTQHAQNAQDTQHAQHTAQSSAATPEESNATKRSLSRGLCRKGRVRKGPRSSRRFRKSLTRINALSPEGSVAKGGAAPEESKRHETLSLEGSVGCGAREKVPEGSGRA